MQVLILAAGKGKRMGDLTKNNHKSLLMVNETESFLTRLLNQLNEYPIDNIFIVTGYMNNEIEKIVKNYQVKITTVYNKFFESDTNIFSMKLALENIDFNHDLLIIEADIYVDDNAIKKIINCTNKSISYFFTKGFLKENVIGGIVLPDELGYLKDIKIINKYNSKFKNYYKMTGIQSISKIHLNLYQKLLVDYLKSYGKKNYYHLPIIENLNKFKFKFFDLDKSIVESVNTADEYNYFYNNLNKISSNYEVSLVGVDKLRPIESFNKDRFEKVYNKIMKNGIWNKPIIIEKNLFLILDGHHRFEVAKKMKIKKIPVIMVDYNEIEIWSLRKDEIVNHELVINRSLKGDIYPEKTVKHNFNFPIPSCKYYLKDLSI